MQNFFQHGFQLVYKPELFARQLISYKKDLHGIKTKIIEYLKDY